MSPFNESAFKAPCKDCKDRHRACHDSCEKYKKARELWRGYVAKERQQGALNSYEVNVSLKAERARRRKHK